MESLWRKPGRGGQNKKWSDEFLMGLVSPTTTVRAMAKEVNVNERTVRRGVRDLGLLSHVRRG